MKRLNLILRRKSAHWLALLFTLFCGFYEAHATHLAGGEITYTCIAPRKWTITLVVYRYCGPDAADLCFSSNCSQPLIATPSATIAAGGLNPSGCTANPAVVPFNVQLVSVEDAEKSRIARCGPSGKNECTNMGAVTAGPYRPSFEKYTFQGVLDMSASSLNAANTCAYWDIGWDYCCRNTTENIQGQPNFWVQTTINIFDVPSPSLSNNSPILKEEAIISFCANQEYIYNMGASDPDGDSLSYQITKALQGANTPVNYNAPYNERYPFPLNSSKPPHSSQSGNPFVVIDNTTGDISFNALNATTVPIAGELCVNIYQWGHKPDVNGIPRPYVKGVTMRNLQILSISCPPNDPPRFITNPAMAGGGARYNWEVCAGEQICFTITATDTAGDSTFIVTSNNINRPSNVLSFIPDYITDSILASRPKHDRWRFCWQTQKSDGSSLPYFFTVKAEDNQCPSVGKVVQGFSIRVIPEPEVNFTTENVFCGNWDVKMRQTNGMQQFSQVKMEIATTPFDYSFANGKQTTIKNNPVATSIPGVIISDRLHATQPGRYMVRYTITTSLCSKIFYDTLNVTDSAQNLIKIDLPDTVIKCTSDDGALLVANVSGGVKPYSYRWFRNNTLGVPVNGPSFRESLWLARDSQTTRYFLRVQDLRGCSILDSVLLRAMPELKITGDQLSLIADSTYDYSITAPVAGGVYNWSVQNGIIVEGNPSQAVKIKWTANGAGSVQAIFSGFGCTDTVIKATFIGPFSGLKDVAAFKEISIRPNPNNGMFMIELDALHAQHISMALHNVLGEQVWSDERMTASGLNQMNVSADVSDGIYLLTVSAGSGKMVKRVVISH